MFLRTERNRSGGFVMPSAAQNAHSHSDWKSLYTAALFANNPARISERIAMAEAAIMRRENELRALSGDHIDEQQHLEDAMYALGALRKTVQLRSSMRADIGEWEPTGT
jgi:hypothetical protein